MQSKNKDWFKRGDYFRNWSRVLIRGGGDYTHQVEVQLTPVNDNFSEWLETSVIMIHRHNVTYSAFKDRNLWTHELPEEIADKMNEHLSKEIVNLLLHADLYPLIDWERYEACVAATGSPYVPLNKCIREFSAGFQDIIVQEDKNEEYILTAEQFANRFMINIPDSHLLMGGYHETHLNDDYRVYIVYNKLNSHVSLDVFVSTPDADTIIRSNSHRAGDWERNFTKVINDHFDRTDRPENTKSQLLAMVARVSVYIKQLNNQIAE